MTLPAASTGATVVFLLIVLAVAILFVLAVRRAWGASPAAWGVTLGALAAYLAIPALLASRGALDRYDPMPAPALLVVLAVTLVTFVLAFSSFGARLIERVPLAALVGYQAFRVPVEWWLHQLAEEGVVPVQMSFAGRNFDIVSGLTAAGVGLWLLRGGRSRAVVRIWNVVGLALLINIIAIAVLSTPVPFRRFLNDPPNLLPSTFPWLWLPSFLVQAALFGHLVVFRALARKAGDFAPARAATAGAAE